MNNNKKRWTRALKDKHYPGYYIHLTPRLIKDLERNLSHNKLKKKYPDDLIQIVKKELKNKHRLKNKKITKSKHKKINQIHDFEFIDQARLKECIQAKIKHPVKQVQIKKEESNNYLQFLLIPVILTLAFAVLFSAVEKSAPIGFYLSNTSTINSPSNFTVDETRGICNDTSRPVSSMINQTICNS